jgi:hypothetical protein
MKITAGTGINAGQREVVTPRLAPTQQLSHDHGTAPYEDNESDKCLVARTLIFLF